MGRDAGLLPRVGHVLQAMQPPFGPSQRLTGFRALLAWQIWDPEGGSLVHALDTRHDGGDREAWGEIVSLCVFESELCRYRLAAMNARGSIRVWDLGPSPSRAILRAAGKLGD
jgi:hypothetical protein